MNNQTVAISFDYPSKLSPKVSKIAEKKENEIPLNRPLDWTPLKGPLNSSPLKNLDTQKIGK